MKQIFHASSMSSSKSATLSSTGGGGDNGMPDDVYMQAIAIGAGLVAKEGLECRGEIMSSWG